MIAFFASILAGRGNGQAADWNLLFAAQILKIKGTAWPILWSYLYGYGYWGNHGSATYRSS